MLCLLACFCSCAYTSTVLSSAIQKLMFWWNWRITLMECGSFCLWVNSETILWNATAGCLPVGFIGAIFSRMQRWSPHRHLEGSINVDKVSLITRKHVSDVYLRSHMTTGYWLTENSFALGTQRNWLGALIERWSAQLNRSIGVFECHGAAQQLHSLNPNEFPRCLNLSV